MKYRPRLLLADDFDLMLQRVKTLLDSEFDVVGAVENGRALVDAAVRLNPDVLVVDICMPQMNGIDAVREIKKSGSKAKVVFLTVHEGPDWVAVCREVGALGFVLKARIASDLVSAIRAVLAGQIFLSTDITGTISLSPASLGSFLRG